MSSPQNDPPFHRPFTSPLFRRTKHLIISAVDLISCGIRVKDAPPPTQSPNFHPPSPMEPLSPAQYHDQQQVGVFETSAQQRPPRLPSPYSPYLIFEPSNVGELLDLLPSPPSVAVHVPSTRGLRSRGSGEGDIVHEDGIETGALGKSDVMESVRSDVGEINFDPGSELITGGTSLSLQTAKVENMERGREER